MTALDALAAALREGHGLALKRRIQPVARRLAAAPNDAPLRNGDDAAAILEGDGYLLFAAEGMLPTFLRADPWFAGFSSIMVNVSDIAAMGGRPLAVVDVWWQSDDLEADALWDGMITASRVFGVPIVGGHTGTSVSGSALAVAIVGRARRLISSFAARPEQSLLLAVDLRGRLRGSSNFDAATAADPEALRRQLALLPELAEAELVVAGKDVSMGGISGTLVMLCEASGVGAVLEVDAVPRPPDIPLPAWLQVFPSFGYLLTAAPDCEARVIAAFERCGVACARVGRITPGHRITVARGDRTALVWDLSVAPLTGFGPVHAEIPACP